MRTPLNGAVRITAEELSGICRLPGNQVFAAMRRLARDRGLRYDHPEDIGIRVWFENGDLVQENFWIKSTAREA